MAKPAKIEPERLQTMAKLLGKFFDMTPQRCLTYGTFLSLTYEDGVLYLNTLRDQDFNMVCLSLRSSSALTVGFEVNLDPQDMPPQGNGPSDYVKLLSGKPLQWPTTYRSSVTLQGFPVKVRSIKEAPWQHLQAQCLTTPDPVFR